MAFDPLALAVPGLRSLTPYEPGKHIDELKREFGLSDVVKLASNENPRAAGPLIWEALEGVIPKLSRYPDGGGLELKLALSDHLHVTADQITLGNGSNEVLEMVARAFVQPGQRVVVSEHSFAVYSLIAKAINADLHVTPAIDWGHDLNAMRKSVDSNTRLVFIANPNNPTGTWVSNTILESFLETVPDHVLVILDEAYFEYVEEEHYPDGVSLLNRYPNLVVTRTFSKIYGLAGMRVGYSISSPEVADIVNRVRQPFNVNVAGYAAAIILLANQKFVRESRDLNTIEMGRMCKGLGDIGLSWIPSAGNFIAVDLARPAEPIVTSMLRAGVIVRPIANYGMPSHIRVTIGLEQENKRALDALESAVLAYSD